MTSFYHRASSGEERPVLYRGYAYRPYYRDNAHRRLPCASFCVADWRCRAARSAWQAADKPVPVFRFKQR
ncbi:hypothetical protein [Bradyrhizobium guangxiense]|uniref:hypothetical protein n=1 Tax=Bradyrhizobium guangxiense TaxID=1325115 RepID=UPI001009397D|nr:hypothetical protein [Bradyrhizobium guangxiense]